MNDPVLLLDSTVLVAYERDLTHRAQALVLEALADGRLMVTAALSLAVACTELGGENRELAWLVYGPGRPTQRAATGAGRDGSRGRSQRRRQNRQRARGHPGHL